VFDDSAFFENFHKIVAHCCRKLRKATRKLACVINIPEETTQLSNAPSEPLFWV
jgi:hypothetical protein